VATNQFQIGTSAGLAAGAAVIGAVVGALLVPFPNTLHEVCSVHPTKPLVGLAIFNGVLLVLTFIPAASLAFNKPRRRPRWRGTRTDPLVSSASSGFTSEDASTDGHQMADLGSADRLEAEVVAQLPGRRQSAQPRGIVVLLLSLQVLRLLMEIVNACVIVAAEAATGAGFTPTFIFVNILEHGQAAFFVAAVFLSPSFRPCVTNAVARARRCGGDKHPRGLGREVTAVSLLVPSLHDVVASETDEE